MRKTSLLGFSVPPELKNKFESISSKEHKTKSEMFRHLLETYSHSNTQFQTEPTEQNLADILKSYWDTKSLNKVKTIVIGLAIIVNDKKVLIGARKEKDEWVENLTWVFPGGQFETLDFENNIVHTVKQKIGLNVQVQSLISARIHPDSGFKPIQIVALYFYCTPIKNTKVRPGEELKELQWVKPLDVFKYFTTSTNDEVTKFLAMIEKS
jgi:ADP-ribose pyrophosphatase YjhB (NUDIX family)